MTPFTPDQLEFLQTYVATLLRAAVGAGQQEEGRRPGAQLWPGTVQSYGEDPAFPAPVCTVTVDTDPEPRRAHQAEVRTAALTPGDRVLVAFEPPQGIAVVSMLASSPGGGTAPGAKGAPPYGRLHDTTGVDLPAVGPITTVPFIAVDVVHEMSATTGDAAGGLMPDVPGRFHVCAEFGVRTDRAKVYAMLTVSNAGGDIRSVAWDLLDLINATPDDVRVYPMHLEADVMIPAGAWVSVQMFRGDDNEDVTVIVGSPWDAPPQSNGPVGHLDAHWIAPYGPQADPRTPGGG
jgi:hypothetical protein